MSLALLLIGALLLTAGVAVTAAALWGVLIGLGCGLVLLGGLLVASGLFLVPTGPDRGTGA